MILLTSAGIFPMAPIFFLAILNSPVLLHVPLSFHRPGGKTAAAITSGSLPDNQPFKKRKYIVLLKYRLGIHPDTFLLHFSDAIQS